MPTYLGKEVTPGFLNFPERLKSEVVGKQLNIGEVRISFTHLALFSELMRNRRFRKGESSLKTKYVFPPNGRIAAWVPTQTRN